MASPAHVLSEALKRPIANGGLLYTQPLFVGTVPDQPENLLVIYNTSPVLNGRLHKTGRSVIKPGIQVYARATKTTSMAASEVAFARLQMIQTWMDGVRQLIVPVGGESYKIHAIRQASGIVAVGLTEKNTYESTLNVVLSLTKE